MTHPYHHAESSARRFGGVPEDYQELHAYMDRYKQAFADCRHRAMTHHAQGIFDLEEAFGITITNSEGKKVPVRYIGEQHVREDCGGIIPSLSDWLSRIKTEPWMNHGVTLPKRHEFGSMDGVV